MPLCLPPHITHFLQPLDVKLFSSYKHWHDQAVEDNARTQDLQYGKLEFLHALTAIREHTFKPKSIKHAFEVTNIWPIDSEAVLDSIRGAENAITRPLTPPQPISLNELLARTPSTAPEFRVFAQYVEEEVIPKIPSQEMKKKAMKFIKGAEVTGSN